jgi:peptide chain release factor subunit 1
MSNLSKKIELKKLIDKLKKFRGRHTELVSVYVPRNYDLTKIIQTLRDEKGTATNIKDAKNSKAVQNSLEKMIQALMVIKKTPENGLAIFSGNISEKENVENFQVFWIEPHEELNLKLYRCSQKFILGPLIEMSGNDTTYGLIAMDKGEATVGLLEGSSIKTIKTMNSNVPGKHKSGGQSAQRFERIRDGAAIEFYKRIAQVMINEFTHMKNLKGIIIGGPGTTKNNFYDGSYINEDIKRKLIGSLFDITYTNSFGLKELVDKASEVLRDSEVITERKLLQRFFESLSKNANMVSYGLENTKIALKMGAVETLILIDDKFENEVLDELSKLTENTSSKLEIVSNKTPEGSQLNGLSGIGAILRYPVET